MVTRQLVFPCFAERKTMLAEGAHYPVRVPVGKMTGLHEVGRIAGMKFKIRQD